MYADRAHLSHGSRPVSLGASFLISGGVIAALAYATPGLITRTPPGPPIHIIDINTPPDPEPIPQPKPRPQTPHEETVIAPKPVVDTLPQPTDFKTDTTIPDNPPLPFPGTPEGTGTTVTPDPPKPVPPLIGPSYDPRYNDVLQPPYPTPELRLNREGDVVLRVHIGVDGHVVAVERVSATSDAFFESARKQALGKWRFKPATRGGVPQESWRTMKLHFKITS